MKTVWVALVLLAMATTLYAKTRGYVHPVNRPIVHSRTSTKSNAPRCANAMNPYMLCKNTAAVSKKFCNECQRVEDAKAEERAKDMMERLKNVSVPKVALDENGRIVSICGYELGTIFRKGPRFIVDESGDIVVSGRLKKPFRKCNQVTLRYSKNSGALYSIRIFSNPQENMDRNKADEELIAMTQALSAKFSDTISGWGRTAKNTMSASYRNLSGQSLAAYMEEQEIGETGLVAAGKCGWVFSVTLEDWRVRKVNLFDVATPREDVSGAEAL